MSQDCNYMQLVQFNFQSTRVYFATVQSMSHNYSLYAMITVYVPRLQFMSQEHNLYPKSTFYVIRV